MRAEHMQFVDGDTHQPPHIGNPTSAIPHWQPTSLTHIGHRTSPTHIGYHTSPTHIGHHTSPTHIGQNRSRGARMLQKYANIVSEKRLNMMELHSSPEQVRTIANSMTVQHFPAHHTLEQCLQGLSSAVEEAGPDVPVPIENLLPSERRKRNEYVEHVKAGMNMPTVLVTYSPGGNISNLHWIWHTTLFGSAVLSAST